MAYDLVGKRVWVAGHRGMVGSALMRRLAGEHCTILFADRSELDLSRQAVVEDWIEKNRPDAIFLAAARVGGILANSEAPADFLGDNLAIALNVIRAAHRSGVEKLLFLGSACIYPKFAQSPIEEDALLSGALEPTNEAYAIAKIAGIKLCQAYRSQYGNDFISAMPANLYGPGDNYDLRSSHVIPALILKAHQAKLDGDATISIWGSGEVRREFLHVDDCADACVALMKSYSGSSPVNIGSGEEISIFHLAEMIGDVVGFSGDISRDVAKPDGVPRRLLSGGRLRALGWTAHIGLREGLAHTYAAFLAEGRAGRSAGRAVAAQGSPS